MALFGKAIVVALGGVWRMSQGQCHCPAHDDRTPSLALREKDGRTLVRCHAGCSQQAVIEALKRRGLWQEDESGPRQDRTLKRAPDPSRVALAQKLWMACADARGTKVEHYLDSRAVELPELHHAVIRFHPALRHPSGGTWPAMVAAITCAHTAELIGVHRTFLDRERHAKAAIWPDKMVLGSKRGGVIRLVADEDVTRRLAVAEGIETALSAISAGWPCWSAIDAGNMASLPAWPGTDLAIFADNDKAGIAGANALARRWLEASGSATILLAPEEGEDWNDVAQQLARVA